MTDRFNPISILHITDPHILTSSEERLLGVNTAYYLDSVLNLALNPDHAFDLCLLTGDLVQLPTAASYQNLLNVLEEYNLQVTCLPGNHDDLELMQQFMDTDKVNCLKQIILGNWQVLCLNSAKAGSDGGFLSAEELDFLARQLDKLPDLFSLVAVHHHCFPCGSRWLDTMMIENSNELLTLIGRYPKVKLLVNGHIHQEVEKTINHLKVLSTPSTCFQFKPFSKEFSLDSSSPGYRRIELFPDGSYRTQVYRLPEPLSGLTNRTEGY